MNIREAVDKYDRKASEYIVAFLDVLGTKSKMNAEIEKQFLNLNILHK